MSILGPELKGHRVEIRAEQLDGGVHVVLKSSEWDCRGRTASHQSCPSRRSRPIGLKKEEGKTPTRHQVES